MLRIIRLWRERTKQQEGSEGAYLLIVWRHIARQYRQVLISVLGAIGLGALSTVVLAQSASVLSLVIDQYPHSSTSNILLKSGLFLALVLGGQVLAVSASLAQQLPQKRVAANLRLRLLQSILGRFHKSDSPEEKGEWLRCVSTGTESSSSLFLAGPITILSALIGGVIAVATNSQIQAPLLLAGLVPALVVLTFSIAFQPRVRTLATATMKAGVRRLTLASTAIESVQSIRSAIQEDNFSSQLAEAESEYLECLSSHLAMTQSVSILTSVAYAVNLACMFSLAASGLVPGSHTAGTIMGTAMFSGILLNMAKPMAGIANRLALASPDIQTLGKHLREEESLAGLSVIQSNSEELLQVRNLLVTYPGTDFAAHCEGLSLDPGELLVLTGRNASGKSSFLRSCSLVQLPVSGSLTFREGSNGSLLDSHRSRVRYASPESLFLTRESMASILAAVHGGDLPPLQGPCGIEDSVVSVLESLSLRLEKRGFATQSGLSQGQSSLVALLALLSSDAEIGLLDEMDAHLDQSHLDLLVRSLEWWIAHGRAAIVVTHSESFVHRLTMELDAKQCQVEWRGSMWEIVRP